MNKLRFWRIERGLSQIELAESSNVPRHVIQLWEQGIKQPDIRVQNKISASLGISTSDLHPKSTKNRKTRDGNGAIKLKACKPKEEQVFRGKANG